MPPKSTKAKKTATPIAKAGATSVDPLLKTKKSIEDKLASAVETVKAEVDDQCPGR